jgi:hypothetical protein
VFTSSRCPRTIASGAPLIFQRGAAVTYSRGNAGRMTTPLHAAMIGTDGVTFGFREGQDARRS